MRRYNQRGRLYRGNSNEELDDVTEDEDTSSVTASSQSAIERSRWPSQPFIKYDPTSMTIEDYLSIVYANLKDVQAKIGTDGQRFRCKFGSQYPENLEVLCLGDRNAVRLIEIKLATDRDMRDRLRANRAESYGPTATIFNSLSKIKSWCLSDSFEKYKRYVIFAGVADLELSVKNVEGKTFRPSSAGRDLLHIVAAIATRNPGALIYVSMLMVPPKYSDSPQVKQFAAKYNKMLGFLWNACPFLLSHRPHLLNEHQSHFVEEGDYFDDGYLEDFAWILDGNW